MTEAMVDVGRGGLGGRGDLVGFDGLGGRTVLQVIPDLEVGGAERTTVDIAAAVVAAGGRAIVASAGGRLVAELEAAGAAHVAMPAAGSKSPAQIAANARRLAALIRRENVDIVHARSRAPAWAAFLAARRTDARFVTTYHGAYGQRGPLKAFYNSVMARGDRVIANSAYTARLIADRHPLAAGRIVTIPRGVDLAAFAAADAGVRGAALREAWGIAPGAFVILHLARLTRLKGQRVLIDALAHLAAAGSCGAEGVGEWTAVLAGDTRGREAYRAELLAAIAAAGLDDRVRLSGPCSDAAAAMAAADLVVVPSTEPETFGRVAVEAQAAGRSVIVSDLGAAPETVLAPPDVPEAQRTGWRVPAGDAGSLAAAIAGVLAMAPAERAALGGRGRAHVAGRFSVERMQQSTLAVYSELCAPADFGYGR